MEDTGEKGLMKVVMAELSIENYEGFYWIHQRQRYPCG